MRGIWGDKGSDLRYWVSRIDRVRVIGYGKEGKGERARTRGKQQTLTRTLSQHYLVVGRWVWRYLRVLVKRKREWVLLCLR